MFPRIHITVFIDETGSKWLHHQVLHVKMQDQICYPSSASCFHVHLRGEDFIESSLTAHAFNLLSGQALLGMSFTPPKTLTCPKPRWLSCKGVGSEIYAGTLLCDAQFS
jgi:hypothetical protein